MTILYHDGFDTGDFSGWALVIGSTALPTSEKAHHANYSMKLTSDFQGVRGNDFTPVTLAYARCYINFSSLPVLDGATTEFLRLVEPITANYVLCAWIVNTAGTVVWRLRDGAGNTFDAASGPLLNTWYCVEIKHTGVKGDPDRLYVDGVEVATGNGYFGVFGTVTRVDAVQSAVPIAGHIFYIDCVFVSDEYLGVEEPPTVLKMVQHSAL